MIAKRKTTCLMLLTLAVFAVGGAVGNRRLAADDKPADVREKLMGVWQIVAFVSDGKKHPESEQMIKEGKVIIAKDRLFLKVGDKTSGGPFALEAAKKPAAAAIDYSPIGNMDAETRPIKGIIFLEGDYLELCLPMRSNQDRPTEFASTPMSGLQLITLKRDTKAKPAEAKEIAELEIQALRAHSANNLKQIGTALLSYHVGHSSFPAAAIMSKDGKPLLSWRVALLPYLEADKLYRQFKLDEPWDSEHNQKLLAKMPRVYAPVGVKTKEPDTTFYQGLVGKHTVLDWKKSQPLENITDGTSQTVMVVEAGKPVPWTKPEDLAYDADKPLPELGGMFKGDFHILMASGDVGFVQKKFDEKSLRALITRAHGEVIEEKVLESFQLRIYRPKIKD